MSSTATEVLNKFGMYNVFFCVLWMGTAACYAGLSCRPQLRLPAFSIICSSDVGVSRRQALEQLDKKLAEGDDKAALSHAKDLQGKPGGLRCFGAARQVVRISSWSS
jgi:hypothetical protein